MVLLARLSDFTGKVQRLSDLLAKYDILLAKYVIFVIATALSFPISAFIGIFRWFYWLGCVILLVFLWFYWLR